MPYSILFRSLKRLISYVMGVCVSKVWEFLEIGGALHCSGETTLLGPKTVEIEYLYTQIKMFQCEYLVPSFLYK